MPSEADLINDALTQIGANTIVGIDDGTTNANHAKRLYPALRDDLQRLVHWRFNCARIELAQDAIPPLFEFAFQYTLPPDLLKIREFNGALISTTAISLFHGHGHIHEQFRYKIEGRKLLTNMGEAKIVYSRREEDPTLWDPMFYQLLATWLGSKLALAITKDEAKATSMLKAAMEVLMPMAVAVDGQEGSVEPYISDALIRGRGF